MYKKYANLFFLRLSSLYLALVVVLEGFLSLALFGSRFSLGFGLGLLAFFLAFLGLEMIARRVFADGSVRGGVLDSLGWVFLKFCGPILVFFVGVRLRVEIFAMFVGLVAGLVSISLILWLRVRFSVKND